MSLRNPIFKSLSEGSRYCRLNLDMGELVELILIWTTGRGGLSVTKTNCGLESRKAIDNIDGVHLKIQIGDIN